MHKELIRVKSEANTTRGVLRALRRNSDGFDDYTVDEIEKMINNGLIVHEIKEIVVYFNR